MTKLQSVRMYADVREVIGVRFEPNLDLEAREVRRVRVNSEAGVFSTPISLYGDCSKYTPRVREAANALFERGSGGANIDPRHIRYAVVDTSEVCGYRVLDTTKDKEYMLFLARVEGAGNPSCPDGVDTMFYAARSWREVDTYLGEQFGKDVTIEVLPVTHFLQPVNVETRPERDKGCYG